MTNKKRGPCLERGTSAPLGKAAVELPPGATPLLLGLSLERFPGYSARVNPKTKQILSRVIGVVVLIAAVVLGVKHIRPWVVLDNFGVVVPGKIYRSGQPKPYQLETLIRKYGIRTVINTREPEVRESLIRGEQEICDRTGARLVRIRMPGDGRGTYEQYEEAVALLRDPTNLPALVHCARGSYRSGAVIASYRALAQGWSEDDAIREMAKYRARTDDHVLIPYLREYFRSRPQR
jgi:protein tyrosine/serine phosphatase